jgi:hypothetical protein
MAKGDARATPVDAERALLREAGYTDEEISKYFVERLHGAQQAPAAGGAPVQDAMTGALGNANAVLSHTKGKGTMPALKANLANLSNSAAPAKSRGKSAPKLAGAAVIIAALGFAISTAGVRGLFTAVAVLLITGVKAAKRPISSQQKTAEAADCQTSCKNQEF